MMSINQRLKALEARSGSDSHELQFEPIPEGATLLEVDRMYRDKLQHSRANPHLLKRNRVKPLSPEEEEKAALIYAGRRNGGVSTLIS